MDSIIFLFLAQTAVVNGAIYALLAVAMVLMFAVTRVIFVPQGEYVAFAALTLAALEAGQMPGTVWLLLTLGGAAALAGLWRLRRAPTRRAVAILLCCDVLLPAGLALLAWKLAPLKLGLAVNAILTLALITPMGAYIYRLAFQPMSSAPVLLLFIAALGVHLTLIGLGLVVFGPEGVQTPPFSRESFNLGPLPVSGHSLWTLAVTVLLLAGFSWFFARTLPGKALRATAVNRTGARLVGISPERAGIAAFTIAALVGACSGLLLGPLATTFYDTGFIIGLKGFVAAVIGGLTAYPPAAAAAVLVGVIESFASFYASAFKEVIVFTLLIPVLLWRSFLQPHHAEDGE